MHWIISNNTILICQFNPSYSPMVSRQTKTLHHTPNTNIPLHFPYTAHLYTHITHTHKKTPLTIQSVYLQELTRTKTSPIDKPNKWNTPRSGTIRTYTTILSLSQWFQDQLNEYTTRQTPAHNLRRCHTSHKTGSWWSMFGILLCG